MIPLEELVASALSRDPAHPAIEFASRWCSWGQLRMVADQVNALLDAAGVDAQAPVAFVARNRPSAVAALLGLIAAGRHIRMIYAFQSPEALARAIDQAGAAAAITMAEDDSEEFRSIFRTRGIAAITLDGMAARALAGCASATANWRETPAAPEIHVLTSGTTGPPKQFAVSYELIARDMVGDSFMARQLDDAVAGPPLFLYFPLGNITGIYSTLPALIQGARIVLVDRFSLVQWHDFVLRYRPIAGGIPPPAVQMVLDAGIPREDLACIRWIFTGAAPLDPAVQRAFESHYGIPILLSYGATEFAGPAVAMTPELYAQWGDRKFGTVGRPLPGIELRVVDPDSGIALQPGEEGLLEVIVPRIGPDWIRTADIAVVDEDGFMFHRGRADGAIMRGGFKILPETIERALLLHEAISAAGVVGIRDRRLGQVPAAAVVLKPGAARPRTADLENHLRGHVLATFIPAAWRFVPELPKNPSFKIDRPALRALFD